MSVSTVHAVYFSGTGTTEKTVRRIAAVWRTSWAHGTPSTAIPCPTPESGN